MNAAKKSSNPLIWIIPTGCFGILFLTCGGCILLPLLGVVTALKSSQGYTRSMDIVKADSRVIAVLGEPIEGGLSIKGNFNSSNGRESVSLTYPISGPNGSGTVEADGTGVNGKWTFQKLLVTANEKRIDLLSEEGIVLEPDRVKAANDSVNEDEASDSGDAAPDSASDTSDADDANAAGDANETGDAEANTEASADASDSSDPSK